MCHVHMTSRMLQNQKVSGHSGQHVFGWARVYLEIDLGLRALRIFLLSNCTKGDLRDFVIIKSNHCSLDRGCFAPKKPLWLSRRLCKRLYSVVDQPSAALPRPQRCRLTLFNVVFRY